ncbi:hypothetical protein B1808_13510 [Pseudofulvimonas gallinarii]|nr:hypothetical protein B1808_13510 [Pseudofulvimonas gallinarii]
MRAMAGGNAVAWLDLGFEQFSAFRFDRGHAALNESLKRDGQLLAAHWLRFQYPLSPAPLSTAHARQYREYWSAGLAAFEALDFRHPHLRAQAWGCVGSCTAFYRHYIDDDLRAEQARYGRLLNRMMAVLDAGEPPRPMRSERRRILVCSAYLYQHTVARLFLPLFEALDRERFDLHIAHFGSDDDAMTARARATGTFHGPRNASAWRTLIRTLAPDVIVYLDLGMHPFAQGLAALRLAPVQCSLWGHPVTSGLPTIDYALSPDAFEPANAQDHYTERLVRLPGFGHGLDPIDTGAQTVATDRREATDLLCAQSIYKLMPEQDEVFARILAQVPGTRLHLIPHQDESVRQWLLARMRPRLLEHGVDPDTRVVLHGYRPLAEFLALADGCAVNLDAIGWSGGMSAIDLLRRGIPTVTLTGQTMRTRQTACLLRHAGLPELVANDVDGYVTTAVALATQPALRERIGQHLLDHGDGGHDRQAVIAALSQFLANCQPPQDHSVPA